MFEKVSEADFIRGEHQALRFWSDARIFQKLREKNANGKEWSFLDGPITANNPMGVHHAWGRTYKDAYQRYYAMNGRKLRYQNGFDCQGLWVEVEVEKELFPKSTKQAIIEHGIDKFVNACKQRVLKFAARQTEQSIRLGYWMDWDRPDELRKLSETVGSDEPVTYQPANGEPVTDKAHNIVARLGNPEWGGSYFTFSTENNETIWTFLKTCFERGKVYRGYDVMPWSGRGGSAYSQMEVADGRKLTVHRSVFARFPIVSKAVSGQPSAVSGRRLHDASAQELPPTKDAYHTLAAEERDAARRLPESESDPKDSTLSTESAADTEPGTRPQSSLNPQPSTLNPPEYLLVWTTTPWTLTSNVACAVNPNLDYVKLRTKRDGAVYYFAKDNLDYQRLGKEFKEGFGRPEWGWPEGVPKLKTIAQIFKEQGGFEIEETIKGAEMVGWQYAGPFDDLPAQQAPGGWPAEEGSRQEAAGRTTDLPQSQIANRKSAIDCHRVIDGGRDSKGNPNVVAGEGTGIVHIAPGCGDIDHQLGLAHGLVGIAPLGEDGTFLDGFGEFTGKEAIDPATAELVFERLRDRHMLVNVEQYPHIYPHCWRTGDELVFRLVDEWFINMDWRDEIKEVVRTIHWLPDSIQGRERELEWLTIMRDWMVSKKRFWGLALPIWVDEQTGEFEVIGSLKELEQRAKDGGEGWDEFEGHTPHRPWIDKVKIRNPKTGNLMSRVPDVGNPWLDAGIVPFSTMQFNTNRDEWRKWYPADFVTECFPGQFRNWFYAMLSMATMMLHEEATPEAKRPFKTLLGHRLVMNEDGKPMHKSDGTAIWFEEAAEQLGVDTMRWMYLAQNPAVDLRFGTRNRDNPVTLRTPDGPVGMTAEGVPTCEVQSKPADEVRRQILIPLWNSYAFFVNYARLDEFDPRAPQVPVAERPEIDRWLLSNLQALVEDVNREFQAYNVADACRFAADFIDDLSNWYIRRNRRRFWRSRTAGDHDKLAAYQTLYEVLLTLTKLLSPMIPFLCERMYQNLVIKGLGTDSGQRKAGSEQEAASDSAFGFRLSALPQSVHLCDYPQPNPDLLDASLNQRMAAAQLIVRLGHKLREDSNLRVRQPLAELQYASNDPATSAAIETLTEVVADELNVKQLTRRDHLDELVHYIYKPNLKTLGPKYGKLLNTIKQRLPDVDPQQLAPLRAGESVTVTLDGHEITLQPDDVQVGTQQSADWVVADDRGLQIALSTHLTPELIREGMARDFVRQVQQLRKDANLEIEDRIGVCYQTESEDVVRAVEEWSDYLRTETQAGTITRANQPAPNAKRVRVGDLEATVWIEPKKP